jgi:hypothetical protein
MKRDDRRFPLVAAKAGMLALIVLIPALCLGAEISETPTITLVANAEGGGTTIRAEHMGGNKGIEPLSGGRLAHLAEIGFCKQPDADSTGWCQRDSKREERLCVLHQPHAGQHSNAARCRASPGANCGDQ